MSQEYAWMLSVGSPLAHSTTQAALPIWTHIPSRCRRKADERGSPDTSRILCPSWFRNFSDSDPIAPFDPLREGSKYFSDTRFLAKVRAF